VDDYEWPRNPSQWYWGGFVQITCQNVFFAVFLIGLLKVCEKISNPLSAEFLSFPERAYEVFLHNNVMALRIGEASFCSLPEEDDFNLARLADAQEEADRAADRIIGSENVTSSSSNIEMGDIYADERKDGQRSHMRSEESSQQLQGGGGATAMTR
jgi:hypothetical protein